MNKIKIFIIVFLICISVLGLSVGLFVYNRSTSILKTDVIDNSAISENVEIEDVKVDTNDVKVYTEITVSENSNSESNIVNTSEESDIIAEAGEMILDAVELEDDSFTIWLMSNYLGLPAGTKLKANDVDDEYIYTNDILQIPRSICLVNLPDVLQPEMQYMIHNAAGSQYHVRDYDLDGISGEILYPGVMQEDGSFYVPLLYDVAMNLYEAEEIAISEGYTLKVYDAYRPYVITTDTYKKMSQIVANDKDIKNAMLNRVGDAAYGQSWFLASGKSNHNFGVAVDITLADLETGEELEMQTKMVDLSNASAVCNNNDNSNKLRNIMMDAGFGPLVSEWWHFEMKEYKRDYGSFQIY